MFTPNHLSILGIIHTAISVLAIFAALYGLYLYGRIDPKTIPGKSYIWLTVLTCLTGLPIMRFGHPTAGHYLSIILFILLPIGIYASRIRFLGKLGEYIQVIVMSATAAIHDQHRDFARGGTVGGGFAGEPDTAATLSANTMR